MTHEEIKAAARIPEDFNERLGNCFELAARYMMATPTDTEARLVHGEIFHPSSPIGPIHHGWVDLGGGDAYCPVADKVFPLELAGAFFGGGTFTPLFDYDREEAMECLVLWEHFGPWDEAFYEEGERADGADTKGCRTP